MAGVACFLASDDAAYITGQTIFVDGGLTLFADFREPWSARRFPPAAARERRAARGESPIRRPRRGAGPAARPAPGPGPSPVRSPPAPREALEDLARSASGMPGPSSSTVSSRAPRASRSRVTATREPPWRRAFSIRLSTSSRRPSGQPVIRCSPSGGGQLDVRLGVPAARRLDRGVDHLRHVERLARQRGGRVAARQRLQRIEHRHEVLLLARDVVEDRAAARASGIDGLRRTASMFARIEVSGVRTSCPTSPGEAAGRLERALRLRGGALQPRQHLVHSVRELVDLAAGLALRQAARQVARAGHAGDRAPQPRQRRQRRAGEQAREEHREADAERRDQRHPALHRVDAVLQRAGVGAELDQPLAAGPEHRRRAAARPSACATCRRPPRRSRSPAGGRGEALRRARRPLPAGPGRRRSRARTSRSRRAAAGRARSSPPPSPGARGAASMAPRPGAGPRRPPGRALGARSSSRSKLERSRSANVATVATPPAISTSATAAVAAAVTRALMLSRLTVTRAGRIRRRAPCGSSAARRPPPACGAGSRRTRPPRCRPPRSRSPTPARAAGRG